MTVLCRARATFWSRRASCSIDRATPAWRRMARKYSRLARAIAEIGSAGRRARAGGLPVVETGGAPTASGSALITSRLDRFDPQLP